MLFCKKCNNRVAISIRDSSSTPVKILPTLHNGNLEPDSIELIIPQNLKVIKNFYCIGCESEIPDSQISIRCRDCGSLKPLSNIYTDSNRRNYLVCKSCGRRLEEDGYSLIPIEEIWDSFFKE